MTKFYDRARPINLTGGKDIKKTIAEEIARPFTNYYGGVYRAINGEKSAAELPESVFRYRKAEFTLNTENYIEPSELKSLVEEIVAEYKLTGVKIEVTKNRVYKIKLINTLVGERVTYYSVYIDGDEYKIKTITVDPPSDKPFTFTGNRFKTKAEAELKLAEIITVLGE